MSELGTAAAWLLAGAFAWAGIAKVGDRAGTVAALRSLGLPAAGVLASALPAVELGIAGLLLAVPSAGALAALAALAGFTVVLSDRLRRGVVATCGCFGAAGAEPVSWRTVARNGLLGIAAVTALGAGEGLAAPSLPAIVAVSLAALLGVLGLALARLAAETGRVLALGELPARPPVEPAAPDRDSREAR